MRPIELDILLHFYCIAEPYHRPSDAYHEVVEQFLEQGLIKSDNGPSGFVCTEKGNVFVKMILNTPLPVWADPRDLPEGKK